MRWCGHRTLRSKHLVVNVTLVVNAPPMPLSHATPRSRLGLTTGGTGPELVRCRVGHLALAGLASGGQPAFVKMRARRAVRHLVDGRTLALAARGQARPGLGSARDQLLVARATIGNDRTADPNLNKLDHPNLAS